MATRKPTSKANTNAVSAIYFAGGKEQTITLQAHTITRDDIKAALSGASSIDEALTYALLSGSALPITGSDFLKQAKAAWIESGRSATEFHKDKVGVYKIIQTAERVRKTNDVELLTAWTQYVADKQADYADKKKTADAEGKKIAALRIQSPTVNGLAKIVRPESEEVSAIEKAVKFLQKAIDALDADEKLTKAQQQFHSKLIAALADPEAKKHQS